MNIEHEKALNDFLLDIDCLKKLNKWVNRFNIFDVLKVTNAEIRHSNILKWLLDPNENHGLGDSFIKKFISIIIRNGNLLSKKSINLLMQDFYSYEVLRESNHMDLVLLSREEKTAYIIENKIWSCESKNQLKNYYDKSKQLYSDYKLIFAFLTPNGKDASDSKNWTSVSYREVVSELEEVINGTNLEQSVSVLINNYIQVVRKDIMGESDLELKKICNEIYNKHKVALKLIFDNVRVDTSSSSEIITDTISSFAENDKNVLPDGNHWYFFTDRTNNFLPCLDSNSSSWNSSWVYYYFFENYDNKIIIHFEIGGDSLTSELERRMDQLIQCSKKIGNRVSDAKPFKYKRLFTKKLTIDEDNYLESLRDKTKELIRLALENENELFKLIESK